MPGSAGQCQMIIADADGLAIERALAAICAARLDAVDAARQQVRQKQPDLFLHCVHRAEILGRCRREAVMRDAVLDSGPTRALFDCRVDQPSRFVTCGVRCGKAGGKLGTLLLGRVEPVFVGGESVGVRLRASRSLRHSLSHHSTSAFGEQKNCTTK